MNKNFKPHLFLKNSHKTQQFKIIPRAIKDKRGIPKKERIEHGNYLLAELNSLWKNYNNELNVRTQQRLPIKEGEYVTFKSSENNTLNIKSLDSDGAKLLNVKHNPETKQDTATLFIPKNKS